MSNLSPLLSALLLSLSLAFPLPVSAVSGDIAPLGNLDGQLNPGDLVVLQRHIMGLITLPQESITNADVAPLTGADGMLTIGDYVVLQRGLMGLVTLPSEFAAPVISLPPYNPATSNSLTWDAVNDAVSYLVEVQIDNGVWQQETITGSISYTLPATLPTGRYQYRVSACSSSCGVASPPQGFVYQDETQPGTRDGSAVNYSYSYYDPTTKTQLQQQIVHGSRTDLPAGVNDDTTTNYDTAENITSVANALGHTVTMGAYNARGDVGLITDANGVTTELTYHPRGWLLTRTVKDPDGIVANDALTQFEYDAVGQLVKIILPDNSFLSYEYDDARRLVAIENTLGERIEYTLDGVGNRELEVICAAGTGGSTGTACSIQKTQKRVFDGLNRLRKDLGSTGETPQKQTRLDYDKNDNLEIITDGKGQPTNQTYDDLDRLLTQIDPDADNSNTSDNPKVVYGYDMQDRITSVTDQEGLTTLYQYNTWGDMTQVDSPDTGITNYRYDNAGNRVWMQDARGQAVVYRYDALNRLTQVIPVGSSKELVTYGYDDNSLDGSGQINYGIGRITHIVDESGRTDYRYDARGNLRAKTVTIDGLSHSTQYTYTIADQLTSVAYPSGRLVSYARDADGRITDVSTQENATALSQAVVSNLSYKPFGPITAYDFANGISRAMTFDTDYLLTDIEDSGGSAPMDWFYRYDANANIDAIDNQADATRDQSFAYDPVDRLDSADGIYGGITFSYDDVGNRLNKTHSDGGVITTESYTYAYEAYPLTGGVRVDGSHQLDDVLIQKDNGTSDTTRSFVYSAAGNTGQDTRPDGDLLDLHYNALNRYEQLNVNNTATTWYQHNALGQRVKKTTLTDTIYYHYDESGQLLAEMDSQGNVLRDYVYAEGMRVARFDGATAYYFHNDHLGRPIALTDSLGDVAWQVDYLPFGKVYAVVNNIADQELGFPGQILDAESGFFYNYFRDYDPSTGRYIQSDPIGLGDGVNTYVYVAGNPIYWYDRFGKAKSPGTGFWRATPPGRPSGRPDKVERYWRQKKLQHELNEGIADQLKDHIIDSIQQPWDFRDEWVCIAYSCGLGKGECPVAPPSQRMVESAGCICTQRAYRGR